MGRRLIAFLCVLTVAPILLPTASAQDEDVDVFGWGVNYFVSTGKLGTGSMSLGPGYDAKTLVPFDGCASILARPIKGAAGVDAVGVIDNANVIEVNFDEFRTPKAGLPIKDGVGANFTIDGSEDHEGKPQHPSVLARVAAYATASIQVDGYNFTEDGVNPKIFWGSFFVTKQGFRDSVSNKILTKSNTTYDPAKSKDPVVVPGDWEVHMRLEAPGSKKSTPVSIRSRGDAPDGTTITYQETHYREFRFLSQAPGGHSNLTFSVNSRAAATNQGPTNSWFRFTVLAPNGMKLQNFTLTPSSPLAPATKSVNIPLYQFGAYTIEVEGRAVMASYQINGYVRDPPKFDFNFWWEDVEFGKPALKEISDCKDRLLNNIQPAVQSGVGRSPPPTISLQILAAGIGGSAIGVLFGVKLVSDAISTAQFKSVSKRRG